MIEIILIVLVAILIVVIVVFGFILYKKNKANTTPTNNDQSIINVQLEDLKKQFSEINKTLNDSKVESVKSITELNQRVENMDKFQRDLNKFNSDIKTNLDNIHNVAKSIPSISVELKDIADIYKHAKKRGNFGEFQLRTILNDIFGINNNLVKEQYQLKNGVVDFAININDNIVPIDSKFPLDNYKKVNGALNESEEEKAKTLFKRDIVAKFKEVAKYVSKPEGINNVIVFIPSEAIFGDIVDWYGNSILTDANLYNVFLASPTTIAAILKLFASKERDRQLSDNIGKVKIEMVKIFTYFNKVTKDWNEYIRTLMTLTNKAKQLTNTNTQLLKRVKNIENDNQTLLDDVNQTIQSSGEIKNQLEVERLSLDESNDEE